MEKHTIIQSLETSHASFIDYIDSLSTEDFLYAPQDKWTAGQQLDHIYRSVKPVTLAFKLPHFFISVLFGKSNRPGRTYEELVIKYKSKLDKGGKAPKQFIPKHIAYNKKADVIKALRKNLDMLYVKIEKINNTDLDELVLPHPLLGKLTFREMLFFTIYHVEHHHKQVNTNLER